MVAEDIIIAPVVTEKSSSEIEQGKYTFRVNKKATKIDIKRAVEKLFEVKVLNVNTMIVKGKEKRVGRNVGKTSDWKKSNCYYRYKCWRKILPCKRWKRS